MNLGFDFEMAGNGTVFQVHLGKTRWNGERSISVHPGKKLGVEGDGWLVGYLCSRITKGVKYVIITTFRVINVGYFGSLRFIVGRLGLFRCLVLPYVADDNFTQDGGTRGKIKTNCL